MCTITDHLLLASVLLNSASQIFLGVVVYELLHGYTPFDADNQNDIFKRIRNVDVIFPEDGAGIHSSAIQLITCLLVPEPNKRMTLQRCLSSTWLATF